MSISRVIENVTVNHPDLRTPLRERFVNAGKTSETLTYRWGLSGKPEHEQCGDVFRQSLDAQICESSNGHVYITYRAKASDQSASKVIYRIGGANDDVENYEGFAEQCTMHGYDFVFIQLPDPHIDAGHIPSWIDVGEDIITGRKALPFEEDYKHAQKEFSAFSFSGFMACYFWFRDGHLDFLEENFAEKIIIDSPFIISSHNNHDNTPVDSWFAGRYKNYANRNAKVLYGDTIPDLVHLTWKTAAGQPYLTSRCMTHGAIDGTTEEQEKMKERMRKWGVPKPLRKSNVIALLGKRDYIADWEAGYNLMSSMDVRSITFNDAFHFLWGSRLAQSVFDIAHAHSDSLQRAREYNVEGRALFKQPLPVRLGLSRHVEF